MYKNTNNGKSAKEKKDKSSLYYDSSEKYTNYVPFMDHPEKRKERTFVPRMKLNNINNTRKFTPSIENSNEKNHRNFFPKINLEPEKKVKFIPSLDPSKRKEREFIPSLNLNEKKTSQKVETKTKVALTIHHLEKSPELPQKEFIKKITGQISQLTPKFLEYIAYAKKEGRQKVPTPYPNIGTRITNKFKTWISDNEPDANKRNQLLKQINEINQKKYLNLIIKHHVKTTRETQKNISDHLNTYGLFVGPHKIKDIALKQAFQNNLEAVKERFPKGRTRALNIEEMRELAKSRGGQCLSTEYVNAQTKLKWRCGTCTYEWEATPNSIKSQSTWCPRCAKQVKGTIEEMQEIAKSRGGKCLSKEYRDGKTHLKWRCGKGHEWIATPDNIKNRKSWCPKCADGTAERVCRQFFEILFNKKFKKFYPNWLKSQYGNKMHLDGYNQELKIAFEYQGSQHYKFTPYFHKIKEQFKKIQEYDQLKEDLCKKYGVTLIKIPYTVKFKDMEDFIRVQIKNYGIKESINPNKTDYKKFRFNTEDKLKQMQTLANSRGGSLLSKRYINATTKLEWQCEKGHTWWASPNNIKNNAKGKDATKGNWCPECAQRMKYTIEDVKEFAHSKGGACLSNVYKRAGEILKWRCKKNHEFKASFFNIKVQNSWCPKCKREIYFQKYKNLAKKRGGECLSENYRGAHLKLKWKCEKGHIWMATSNSIRQGSWCPICVNQPKYTIEDMNKLAKSFGGECLSKQYLGRKEYLEWRCSEGHEWKATPNNIKSHNNWCPECKKEKRKANI